MTGTARSTPDIASQESWRIASRSPSAPITVRYWPSETWASEPIEWRRSTTALISASVAVLFMTMIIEDISLCSAPVCLAEGWDHNPPDTIAPMADPTPDKHEAPVYEPHVGISRQYWRDIILGVNDGLVSVFLLVAGVVGGGLDTAGILLTALAGSVAGAISMAASEYLATKSQDEVFDSEIELERSHIAEFRDRELDQLRG